MISKEKIYVPVDSWGMEQNKLLASWELEFFKHNNRLPTKREFYQKVNEIIAENV